MTNPRSFDSYHGLWPWVRSGFRPTGVLTETTGQACGAPSQSRRYARIRYRLLFINLVGSWLFLWALQYLGISQAIAFWWSRRLIHEPLIILGYLLSFGLIGYVMFFPLHVYESFVLERQFGLSRLTLKGWCVRESKHLALSAVLGGLLIEGFYAILRVAPTTWPLLATVGWVMFTIVLARIFPTVLLPLFYKTTPVRDEALVKRLMALCERAGQSTLGVFRVDLGRETRKANAALVGLGKSRRVLLSDTLLSNFSPQEIESVLAHELAHHRYRHITKLLALTTLGSWMAFSLTDVAAKMWVERLELRGLDDVAGFPMLCLWLSLLGFIGLPIQNAISRRFEWQSDRFAVAMTKGRVFASALKRLSDLNLADPHPPCLIEWIFFDHPAIGRRIAFAKREQGAL